MDIYLISLFNSLSSVNHDLKHTVFKAPMEKTIWLDRMIQHICKNEKWGSILYLQLKPIKIPQFEISTGTYVVSYMNLTSIIAFQQALPQSRSQLFQSPALNETLKCFPYLFHFSNNQCLEHYGCNNLSTILKFQWLPNLNHPYEDNVSPMSISSSKRKILLEIQSELHS